MGDAAIGARENRAVAVYGSVFPQLRWINYVYVWNYDEDVGRNPTAAVSVVSPIHQLR